jgi:PKD repeat protein
MKTKFIMKNLFLTLVATAFTAISFAQGNCQADFVVDSTSQCPNFQFYDQSTSTQQIVSWHYDFGDGNYAYTPNPSHTYTSNGSYTVCLNVTSADSCWSSFCTQLDVNCITQQSCIDPAQIDTTIMCPQVIDPVCGCDSITYDNACIAENFYGVTSWTPGPCFQQSSCNAGFVVDDSVSQCPSFLFMDVSTGTFNVVEWSYDFGDGSTSTSANPFHTYQSNGTYTVCLYITTADSCTSWFCDQVVVNCLGQTGNCQADFYYDDSTAQCPTFNFYDLSTSSMQIGEWEYDFGDGNTSNSANPTHTYTSNGTYTVCLTTTSIDSCVSTYCQTITVNCLANLQEVDLFEMIISPNPMTNGFSLNLPHASDIRYRIVGLNGQVFDAGERPSVLKHQFDVSQLSKGLYLLEVVVGERKEVLRFMKE